MVNHPETNRGDIFHQYIYPLLSGASFVWFGKEASKDLLFGFITDALRGLFGDVMAASLANYLSAFVLPFAVGVALVFFAYWTADDRRQKRSIETARKAHRKIPEYEPLVDKRRGCIYSAALSLIVIGGFFVWPSEPPLKIRTTRAQIHTPPVGPDHLRSQAVLYGPLLLLNQSSSRLTVEISIRVQQSDGGAVEAEGKARHLLGPILRQNFMAAVTVPDDAQYLRSPVSIDPYDEEYGRLGFVFAPNVKLNLDGAIFFISFTDVRTDLKKTICVTRGGRPCRAGSI